MNIVLNFARISKRYGRQTALDDVSLSLRSGEVIGLVGVNGAGKTTLLRIGAGLLRPSTGVVDVDVPGGPRAIRYFGGERTLPPNVTVAEWLGLWAAAGAARADHRRLGVLSRGTRQSVGLEAMLASVDEGVALLDEPWEGLDPDASRWLSETLLEKRAAGATIVVSSHRIHDLADVCDRSVFLVDGRLQTEAVVFDRALAGRIDRSATLFDAFDRARGR